MDDRGRGAQPGVTMGQEDAALLDRFLEMMAAERGASRNTLLAYRADLTGAGDLLGGLAGATRDGLGGLAAQWATLAAATVAEFEAAHGKVPGGEMLILALGRLGGGVLTHASDLDLIYLFTGDFQTESDGARPLGATLYFNRLAQRVTNALSVHTASGPLYEVDTRLRPSGAQGLLAVSFDSFAKYEREAAWTWEHLALTRARSVFGSPEARAALEAILTETLHRPRDFDELARQAVQMRRDIATHKPPASDLDVKLVPGGLVDLEFLIHVSQFRHGMAFDPDLGKALADLVAAGDWDAITDLARSASQLPRS